MMQEPAATEEPPLSNAVEAVAASLERLGLDGGAGDAAPGVGLRASMGTPHL